MVLLVVKYLLKLFIQSGKYVSRLTSKSILQAYNSSILYSNELNKKYEDAFCMAGDYENVLEMFNSNLEEITINPSNNLVFISDQHKKVFEEYLKEVEDLPERKIDDNDINLLNSSKNNHLHVEKNADNIEIIQENLPKLSNKVIYPMSMYYMEIQENIKRKLRSREILSDLHDDIRPVKAYKQEDTEVLKSEKNNITFDYIKQEILKSMEISKQGFLKRSTKRIKANPASLNIKKTTLVNFEKHFRKVGEIEDSYYPEMKGFLTDKEQRIFLNKLKPRAINQENIIKNLQNDINTTEKFLKESTAHFLQFEENMLYEQVTLKMKELKDEILLSNQRFDVNLTTFLAMENILQYKNIQYKLLNLQKDFDTAKNFLAINSQVFNKFENKIFTITNTIMDNENMSKIIRINEEWFSIFENKLVPHIPEIKNHSKLFLKESALRFLQFEENLLTQQITNKMEELKDEILSMKQCFNLNSNRFLTMENVLHHNHIQSKLLLIENDINTAKRFLSVSSQVFNKFESQMVPKLLPKNEEWLNRVDSKLFPLEPELQESINRLEDNILKLFEINKKIVAAPTSEVKQEVTKNIENPKINNTLGDPKGKDTYTLCLHVKIKKLLNNKLDDFPDDNDTNNNQTKFYISEEKKTAKKNHPSILNREDNLKFSNFNESFLKSLEKDINKTSKENQLNEEQFKKVMRGLTYKYLDIFAEEPVIDDDDSGYIHPIFVINRKEIDNLGDIIELNKKAFEEHEKNMKVVKLIQQPNKGPKVNNLEIKTVKDGASLSSSSIKSNFSKNIKGYKLMCSNKYKVSKFTINSHSDPLKENVPYDYFHKLNNINKFKSSNIIKTNIKEESKPSHKLPKTNLELRLIKDGRRDLDYSKEPLIKLGILSNKDDQQKQNNRLEETSTLKRNILLQNNNEKPINNKVPYYNFKPFQKSNRKPSLLEMQETQNLVKKNSISSNFKNNQLLFDDSIQMDARRLSIYRKAFDDLEQQILAKEIANLRKIVTAEYQTRNVSGKNVEEVIKSYILDPVNLINKKEVSNDYVVPLLSKGFLNLNNLNKNEEISVDFVNMNNKMKTVKREAENIKYSDQSIVPNKASHNISNPYSIRDTEYECETNIMSDKNITKSKQEYDMNFVDRLKSTNFGYSFNQKSWKSYKEERDKDLGNLRFENLKVEIKDETISLPDKNLLKVKDYPSFIVGNQDLSIGIPNNTSDVKRSNEDLQEVFLKVPTLKNIKNLSIKSYTVLENEENKENRSNICSQSSLEAKEVHESHVICNKSPKSVGSYKPIRLIKSSIWNSEKRQQTLNMDFVLNKHEKVNQKDVQKKEFSLGYIFKRI